MSGYQGGALARSVAVVSLVNPYPTDSGKKVVIAGFLEYLADRLGPKNVHYILVGSGRLDVDGFPVRLHQVPGAALGYRLLNIATRCTTRSSSLQEAIVRSPAVRTGIRNVLANVAVDLEVFDTVRLGQYAPSGMALRRICYLDDLFSERYRSMLAVLRDRSDLGVEPLGVFAEHVPAPVRHLTRRPFIQRGLLEIERRLVRHSEDRAARDFERCLLLNKHEVGLLSRRAAVDRNRILAVPPLIGRRVGLARCYRGAPVFVFLGLLSLPHNEVGLCSFLSEVWPRVTARRPDACLRIIGRDARSELLQYVARAPGRVELAGYVADLDSALSSAAALINPPQFGSGLKLKVIEALGAGLPVVSTPIGADGLDSGRGSGITVATAPDEIADALLRLLDTDVNIKASADALAHFGRRYAREVVYRCYDEAFGVTERAHS
jgi:glycosyltransferase involved in cell wall biosynthesis